MRTKEQQLEYYKKNKAAYRARNLKRRNSLTDSFYTLYYLKEEHYVGVTNQPTLRMAAHKSKGRHVIDCEVIATVATKKDALNIERYLHSIGYNGGSSYFFDKFY